MHTFMVHTQHTHIYTHTILQAMYCYRIGGKKDSVHRCRTCSGTGITMQYRQLGPGMVQQMQSKCSDCHGEGEICREKDRCKTCKGQKLIEEEKKLEVRLQVLIVILIHLILG